MSDYFDINDMTKEFIIMCNNNNPDTIEFNEEIKDFRAYNQVKDFKKVIDKNFNDFCFNNSLVHKIDYDLLNDNQKLFYKIISYAFETQTLPVDYKNKIILNYYMKHLNDDMGSMCLENLKDVCNYWYDNIPSTYLVRNGKIEKIDKIEKNEKIKPNFDLVNYTLEFLKIGNSLLFNVDGFPKNQICLLLYGMAIYYAWKKQNLKSFKTFKDLINYLKSFVQINVCSKCLNVADYKKEDEKDFYNLITYLKFKKTDKENYNYRYKCAEKYFENLVGDRESNTKYETSTNGEAYIKTEYKNINEVNKVWEELEEEFKENDLKISDKLINMWFDGQLLTRSTCLIGCMLIMIKEGKFIKFKENEMPDWKSIALNTYEGTYETLNDLKMFDKNENIKLVDVLYMLYNFMNNIKLNFD